MPHAVYYSDDLLEPVSGEQAVGADLRWSAEWDRLKEARRADDELDSGKWAKKERKSADWRQVEELAAGMLRSRTKDLQLALWLTEAGIKLHGFAGLRDGLRLTGGLLARYWDTGLYPPMEDGPEDRAGPFEWLNNKLADSIAGIPITARADGGPDYSLRDVRDARRTGSEAGCRGSDGEIDISKKKAYEAALSEGHVSLEMFERALAGGRRAGYEEMHADFEEAFEAFQALEKAVDDRFGDAAPSLSQCREVLNEIRQEVSAILEQKRREEPDPHAVTGAVEAGGPAARISFAGGGGAESEETNGAWQDAEALVRSGEVEQGLARMVQLSARETCGRSRFRRKLLLAEVCLATRRGRLARSILEELAEQIDQLHLEAWESSELIASVWTPLYELYSAGTDGSDQERAGKLYERLCRLDPWQALKCGEA